MVCSDDLQGHAGQSGPLREGVSWASPASSSFASDISSDLARNLQVSITRCLGRLPVHSEVQIVFSAQYTLSCVACLHASSQFASNAVQFQRLCMLPYIFGTFMHVYASMLEVPPLAVSSGPCTNWLDESRPVSWPFLAYACPGSCRLCRRGEQLCWSVRQGCSAGP